MRSSIRDCPTPRTIRCSSTSSTATQRTTVTDDGGAVARAGQRPGWRAIADRLADGFVVNVTRSGVVCLPVVPVGPPEDVVVRRIGEASLALYQDLLELDG